MNNLDPQYQKLLEEIVMEGTSKQTRNGEVISIFGRQIRHKMSDGFPLLTTKKMAWKSIVTELLWFLRGDTNIKFLLDNDCHIWDGDAYKNYEKKVKESILKATEEGILKSNCEDEGFSYMSQETFINQIKTDRHFADQWGDLGPIYGKQWRKWQDWVPCPDVHWLARGSVWHDQIALLIHQLRTDPDSRRLMVNAWNVSEINQMVLPPCHYGFQVYTRVLDLEERRKLVSPEMHAQIYTGGDSSTLSHSEIDQWKIPRRAISLMWNQRSVDTCLGLPFNIASYGLLLIILANTVNMVPDELIGNLGDLHIYVNQLDKVEDQINRDPYPLPSMKLSSEIISEFNLANSKDPATFLGKFLEKASPEGFILQNYVCHPSIKFPLSN